MYPSGLGLLCDEMGSKIKGGSIQEENFSINLNGMLGGRRGSPSLVKGARLRTLSHRRSWVRIPPPALRYAHILKVR